MRNFLAASIVVLSACSDPEYVRPTPTCTPGTLGCACAAGDTCTVGECSGGYCRDQSGDPIPGDPMSGDPMSGDPLSGDTIAGDPLGDPMTGDDAPLSIGVLVNEVGVGAIDWVEILNATPNTVQLHNWKVSWAGLGDMAMTETGWLTLPAYELVAGGRVVVLDDPADTGAVVEPSAGRIQFHVDIRLDSGDGMVLIEDASETPHDYVRWGPGNYYTPAPPPGTEWEDTPARLFAASGGGDWSINRYPEWVADTDTAGDFCAGPVSQGTQNTGCLPAPPPGTLLINELDGIDPDRVELFNNGSAAINLEVIRLGVSGASRSLPDFVLDAGAYVVVTGDGTSTPTVDGQGIHVSSFNLNPGPPGAPGSCRLGTIDHRGIDFVRWDGSTEEPGYPDIWSDGGTPLSFNGAGTHGRGDGTDDNDSSDWCLMAESIGAANTGCF